MKSPIFLVSTGRTGTKYFSRFFSTYGIDVASYHTTKFTRTLNILGNMYSRNLLSKGTMKTLWKVLKFHDIHKHSLRYIECNPYYYNLINIIADFFPNAKFVFIIRDPKSFIISHIKWEKQRWQSTVANSLVPFWQPTSYLDQVRGLRNNYYQRVDFYGKIWAKKNSSIIKAIKGKENTFFLRFEQVFHPDTGFEVMSRLVGWLDVALRKPISRDMLSTKINKTKGDKAYLWDNTCNRIMNRHCLPLLNQIKYL
ncbi:hypothetical protein PITCH_A2030191 [uncultured Desulfobacterium sp.]|uniref:Sulfotransferase domain-containing protein n=1 Tax=uncultured Desulfobacterium sp. TaxID=201089 RepID=A0A445MX34_9BACT|nr:hypothetical protein PITCH_A2030191 [uncultured Desulfobacterium sp.]